MIDSRIVRRYAAALFRSAQQAEVIDLVESDLGLISYTFESNPALADALKSPLIPAQKKREIVTSIFQGKIHEVTLFYLYLAIDKRREEVITQTEQEYITFANEARGIVTAKVTAAVELTEDEAQQLRRKLGELTGKSVTLEVKINSEIIGGIVVRIGDTVMDGSVKGQLERLRDEFLGR